MEVKLQLLHAARTALGMTREALAAEVGVGVRTLTDLELGRRSSMETYLLVRGRLEAIGIVFLPESSQGGPGFRMPEGWVGNSIDLAPRKMRRRSPKGSIDK